MNITSFIKAKCDSGFDLLFCPQVGRAEYLAEFQTTFQGQIFKDTLDCATVANTLLT
jgi:hypothetical protein